MLYRTLFVYFGLKNHLVKFDTRNYYWTPYIMGLGRISKQDSSSLQKLVASKNEKEDTDSYR